MIPRGRVRKSQDNLREMYQARRASYTKKSYCFLYTSSAQLTIHLLYHFLHERSFIGDEPPWTETVICASLHSLISLSEGECSTITFFSPKKVHLRDGGSYHDRPTQDATWPRQLSVGVENSVEEIEYNWMMSPTPIPCKNARTPSQVWQQRLAFCTISQTTLLTWNIELKNVKHRKNQIK